MAVLEATLRTRGEVTFTSREVGRMADTEPYILNTALYYALGLASGRYVDTSYEPTYTEDTKDVTDIYVSPAAPVDGTAPNYVTTTYNATRDEYAEVNYSAQDDPNAKQNLPSYGRRRSLAHGTPLRFFIISNERSADDLERRLPSYVRLGKKRGKARLDVERRPSSRQTGKFSLNHPIGAYDYPDPPEGNVITKAMKPTPLVMQGDYTSEYISIDQGESDPVRFPAGLTFLATKR
ncbi:hypothetical protein GCM10009647_077290 [Streptomyces sanglieri]